MKPNPRIAVTRERDVGWFISFVLILITLIGSQFSTADRHSGSTTRKNPSLTGTLPGTSSAGDPAEVTDGKLSRGGTPSGQDIDDQTSRPKTDEAFRPR
jgi:hypothetical protein